MNQISFTDQGDATAMDEMTMVFHHCDDGATLVIGDERYVRRNGEWELQDEPAA